MLLQPSSTPQTFLSSSSNGLLLCADALTFHTRYYVCNPLTKCWVLTPPSPTVGQKWAQIGFLCKDFSCGSFVIVRIPNYLEGGKPAFVLKVEICDSEIGQWAESELDDNWRRGFNSFNFQYLSCF